MLQLKIIYFFLKMIFLLILTTLLFVDGLWLFMMANWYKFQLKAIFSQKINYLPVFLFYPMYAFALFYFVFSRSHNLNELILNAFFFGFICYGTYNLTNMATLSAWTWKVSIIDTLWGATSAMIILSITYLIKNKQFFF
jgi:uncharacterized membrane protein